MKRWKLEDAKNQFSEVVREAIAAGPQLVTRSGRDAVVVVSAADYSRLAAPRGLAMLLRDSPLADVLAEEELDLGRDRAPARDIEL